MKDGEGAMPELSEMSPPALSASGESGHAAANLSPAQQLHFYDPDRWEEFVREWATAITPAYLQIKRIGGSGDKGADVAGFLDAFGFHGEWDCFQCKHYANPLAWSDVLPELVKVFRYAAAGEYGLPRRYLFLAPRGLSSTMNRLISRPAALKEKFLKDAPSKLSASGLSADDIEETISLATSDDFSRFRSEELVDVVALHRTTPYFSDRFGAALPVRTQHGQPPAQVGIAELAYVSQLVAVYGEKWNETFTSTSATADGRTQQHFERQRVRFFEAESLRAYAKDSVLPGTFERFQNAILSGVEDVLDDEHPNGWSRMASALTVAGQLNLASHALVTRAEQDDLKGVCHQLANDGRLQWVRG